jgi:adenylate cyclase
LSSKGGERKRLTVLFADIRNSTSLIDSLGDPELGMRRLEPVLALMKDAVHRYDGIVNKIQGDGVMALFGAPQPLECPEKNALEAAQDMLSALRELNARLEADGQPPLKVGIGLHSGEVVLGHVGSHLHQEYAAIGEVVSLAARLEGMTRELNYPVLCSAAVADAVGRAGNLRDLGERAPRGHSPLRIFGWNPPVLSAAEAEMKPA